ncbi:MAG: TetR/AcrR family transcriptional regulator [Chloroflexota bacterium]
MTAHVKPASRRERAAATRMKIVAAAAKRFAAQGYAGTTMEAIAQRAGVAVQTVYFVFHTKPELLIETMTVLAWGPDPRSDIAREWIREAHAAPDSGRRLAIAVEAGAEIYRRVGPMFEAFLAAASADDDVLAAWQRITSERRAGMTRFVDAMADRDELRSGLSRSYATDILVALHRQEVFLAFTNDCGWTVERYKAWLFATLCRELLPAADADAAVRPGSSAVEGTSFSVALGDLG